MAMEKAVLKLLRSLLLCYLTTFTSASVIEFSSTPSSISPPFSPNLTLRCALQNIVLPLIDPIVGRRSAVQTNNNNAHVSSIEILKGTATTGEKVASISTLLDADSFGNWTHATASGELTLNQSGDKGYLNVVVDEPSHSVGGNYTCVIHAIDDTGSSVDFLTFLHVDVHVPTLPDLVNYINDLRHSLTNSNEALTNTVNTLTSENQALVTSVNDLTSQNQGLNTVVNTLIANVDTLTSKNQGLTSSVDALTLQNQGMAVSMDTLTSQNQGLTVSMDTLTSQNQDLTTSIDTLTSQNLVLVTSVDTLTSQNNGLTTELNNLKSELAETRHVERGTVNCGDNHSDTWCGPGHSTTHTTTFTRTYSQPPVVFLSYGILAFKTPAFHDQIDFYTGVRNVTTTEFTVLCADSFNRGIGILVNWIAIPQN